MTELLVLTTNSISAEPGMSQWMSMWGSLCGKSAVKLRSDTFDRNVFEGRISYSTIGRIRICKIEATPHRVLRAENSNVLADNRPYKIVIQISGTSTVEQSGRSVTLPPGEWTIYDAGKPYAIANPENVEQFVVIVPREVITSARFDLQLLVAQPFSARIGVGRLACGLVRVAFEEMSELHLQSTDDLADSLVRLFQQALLERSSQEINAPRTVLLCDRIKTYVENNLRDPNLSIGHLARDLNHSKRNLHRVFAPQGLTISGFIWKMRLESSQRALSAPGLSSRSITEIAYDCGFSSSAHFSRMFKQVVGISPREYRHRHLADAPAM